MNTDIAIIGGGLSGLTTAYKLNKRNTDYFLIEARDRLGGRIKSVSTSADTAIDLGPSWFWPGQHRIEKLIQETGLSAFTYPQYSKGKSVIEYADGQLQKSHGSVSMAGSYRLEGGINKLVITLADSLRQDRILHNTKAVEIDRTNNGVNISASNGGEMLTINARQVILALPPRVVADSINFKPPVSADTAKQLQEKSTWMAAQAKFVSVYKTPFWREQDLAGDGFSQIGPPLEIHDASPASSGPYALFGFVGVSTTRRHGQQDEITRLAIAQINRMFSAANPQQPVSTHYKDWAFDSLTATTLDRQEIAQPHGHNDRFTNEWDDRVIFSGSETAVGPGQSNGYLEGAIESAEAALSFLKLD